MPVRYLHQPRSMEEVFALLGEDRETKIISGGTAVMLMLGQGLIAPERLVSLRKLSTGSTRSWRGIDQDRHHVRIGGGVTLSEVAESPLICEQLPSLARACALVGNVRVRNVATLAGNMAEADYASDPPAVLDSLSAECVAAGPRGDRLIPSGQFITGFYENALHHDEVLREIRLPKPRADRRTTYVKYISRSSEDRPCVGVAAAARVRRDKVHALRVVVGAVAGTPQRCPEAALLLRGRSPTTAAIAECARAHAESIEAMDDQRGSRWYRRRMIEVNVRRALHEVFTREEVR